MDGTYLRRLQFVQQMAAQFLPALASSSLARSLGPAAQGVKDGFFFEGLAGWVEDVQFGS